MNIFLVLCFTGMLASAFPNGEDSQTQVGLVTELKAQQVGPTNSGCVWKGTSPFCAGGCSVEGHVVREISNVGDGEKCLTGQKVLCCPGLAGGLAGVFTSIKDEIGLATNCKWSGTSPFCDGGCDAIGQFVREISKTGDGATCTTGVKVKCCPTSI